MDDLFFPNISKNDKNNKKIFHLSFSHFFGVSGNTPHIRALKRMLMQDSYEEKLCLNCGTPIKGRTDKLFCCSRCKNEWHNRLTGEQRRRRERVFNTLWKNYKILELVMESGDPLPEIHALTDLGFRPEYVTGFCRRRGGRDEYRCFDISYNKTEARLYNIRRAPEIG